MKYYEQEAVTRTVMKPVTRQKYVPYTETIMVPKQVVQRVPLSYTDPFGAAVVSGYSSFGTPEKTATPAIETAPSLGNSILQPNPTVAPAPEDAPRTRMQKIEIGKPTSESSSADDTTEATIEIEEEILPPAQGSGDDRSESENTELDSVTGSKAGWKIHWNPLLKREA